MNNRSRTPNETRCDLNLSRKQLNQWFSSNDGKEVSPFEKPLDTPEHKKLRLVWCQEHYIKLTCLSYNVGYLDEKFFCITSRRNKIKILPKGDNEPDGLDKLVRPKMRSR